MSKRTLVLRCLYFSHEGLAIDSLYIFNSIVTSCLFVMENTTGTTIITLQERTGEFFEMESIEDINKEVAWGKFKIDIRIIKKENYYNT